MKHHEFASLFPMLSTTELQSLADDIKANGQRHSIITLDGEILDGRNRYAACKLANVEPWLEAYQGNDPLAFVVSENLHRRHLDESQRGMVAGRLATLKNGQRPSPIGEAQPLSQESRADAAKALNVGERTLDRARVVQSKGVPELIAAVDSGEVKLGAAENLAKLPPEEQVWIFNQGPDEVKKAAKDLREAAKQKKAARNDPREPKEPKYVPSDAREIWVIARLQLDRIRKTDTQKAEVMGAVIEYCNARMSES